MTDDTARIVANLRRGGITVAAEEAADEIERLVQWKAEATQVIQAWERVWEVLGRPGDLGESKADASVVEIERLAEEVERLRKLVPLAGEAVEMLVRKDEERKLAEARAEVEALTCTASGIWYCRVHSGTVNGDEPHDDDAQCPWHDHDDDRCLDPTDDHDPEYEWCKGECSPCDWVELLIPAVRRALGRDE